MGESNALEKYRHPSAATLRKRRASEIVSLASNSSSDKVAEKTEFLPKGGTRDASSHLCLVFPSHIHIPTTVHSIIAYTNRFRKYRWITDFIYDKNIWTKYHMWRLGVHTFRNMTPPKIQMLGHPPEDFCKNQLLKRGRINEVKKEMECLEYQENFGDSCNVNLHLASPTCLKPFLRSPTLGQEGGHLNNIEENYHELLLPKNINEQSTACLGTMTRVLWPRRLAGKVFVKWAFIVLNVIFEACQATLTQEAAQGNLSRKNYLKLIIITSSVCLLMSLVEAFHEGRGSGVVLRRRGYCSCFHYPDLRGRLFGTFLLYFGIICSMLQLIVNLIAKLTNKDFLKFDYVPLLLSICHLGAVIIISREKTRSFALVKCKNHGLKRARAHAIIDDGHDENWVFECPECQEDIP